MCKTMLMLWTVVRSLSCVQTVHFLNSAALLDRLTMAKVRDFRFRMFTDSAHSMGVRGAYTALHQMMTDFLVEKFGIESRRR